MRAQKHLVFGVGLIGNYLAGALLSQGFRTTIHGREATYSKLRNGFSISDYQENGSQLAVPDLLSLENQGNSFEVIWLTMKCTAVEDAIPALMTLMSPRTILITCQNGLNSDLPLRAAFPLNKIITAIAGYNVAEPKPGHFHRSTEGKLVIQHQIESQAIADQLNCPLLPCRTSNNILADQWAKLQLNLANPVGALSDLPLKPMMENRRFRWIIAMLMSELLIVCDAMDLKIPTITGLPGRLIPHVLRLPNFLFKLLAQKMLAIDPAARLSMWWDLSNNRKTEIEFINGAVVRQATTLGIDCPYNQRILKLIRDVESGNTRIGFTAESLQQQLEA